MTMRPSSNRSPNSSPTMANTRSPSFKSKLFPSRKSRYCRKPGHVSSRKVHQPKEQLIEFPCFSLLGGNRRDPLNLNELIHMSQQQKQITNVKESIDKSIYGNEQPIELLLQPDIYDPLCLDSIPSDHISTEQLTAPTHWHSTWSYDQQVPRWR
ncbi:unnamed protein product [Adineta ricciae]|uniref:Uncharacterized protein n=1 Tax=Adineta ricciae TaxID=249248 RepID=A0A815NE79_ADIRI|nr:unnamed protein product [Adineta ricciae]